MPNPLKIFAADGNWYLHRMHHTAHTNDDLPQRMLGIICRDALEAKCTTVLLAFDGSRVFRHRLFSRYKEGRKQKKEDTPVQDSAVAEDSPYVHLPAVMAFFAEHGVPTIQLGSYEADDVLCTVARKYDSVVLGTKDKDIYQALRPGVYTFDSSAKGPDGKRKPRMMTHMDVEAKLGLKPSQCVDYQTLIGDGIDDIPKIMQAAKAAKGLRQYGSINAWAKADEEALALFRERKAELKLNRKLVKLVDDLQIRCEPISWVVGDRFTPRAYYALKDFCNPKSKGLFG